MTLKHCRFHFTRSLFKAKRVIFNEVGGQQEDFQAQNAESGFPDAATQVENFPTEIQQALNDAAIAAQEGKVDEVLAILGKVKQNGLIENLKEDVYLSLNNALKGLLCKVYSARGQLALQKASYAVKQGDFRAFQTHLSAATACQYQTQRNTSPIQFNPMSQDSLVVDVRTGATLEDINNVLKYFQIVASQNYSNQYYIRNDKGFVWIRSKQPQGQFVQFVESDLPDAALLDFNFALKLAFEFENKKLTNKA